MIRPEKLKKKNGHYSIPMDRTCGASWFVIPCQRPFRQRCSDAGQGQLRAVLAWWIVSGPVQQVYHRHECLRFVWTLPIVPGRCKCHTWLICVFIPTSVYRSDELCVCVGGGGLENCYEFYFIFLIIKCRFKCIIKFSWICIYYIVRAFTIFSFSVSYFMFNVVRLESHYYQGEKNNQTARKIFKHRFFKRNENKWSGMNQESRKYKSRFFGSRPSMKSLKEENSGFSTEGTFISARHGCAHMSWRNVCTKDQFRRLVKARCNLSQSFITTDFTS